VRDTGIGIAPEALNRVFKPFVQAEAPLTKSHGGAGLGLAIARELAERMGGGLVLESTPGVGTTFSLNLSFLPARQSAAPGPQA
jgi:signal transduction histidine kinase